MRTDYAVRLLVDLSQEQDPVATTSGADDHGADVVLSGPIGAARILSDMAAVCPDAVQTVLNHQVARSLVTTWTNEMDPDRLAGAFTGMDCEAVAELLDNMRPNTAAAVIVKGRGGPWLVAMKRDHAAQVLVALADANPKSAAECLTQIDQSVAADLLARMSHDPDPRPAVLNSLPEWLAIALLAVMHAHAGEAARQLLDTRPGWRRMVGTWPSYAATTIVLRTRWSADSETNRGEGWYRLRSDVAAATRLWWQIRLALAVWTSDLHDRRVRDGKVTAATAVVTALAMVLVMAMVWPVEADSAAATGPVPTTQPSSSVPRFQADLPLLDNKAYWSETECPTWIEETHVKSDPTESVTLLLLVCRLKQNGPAKELAYLQFPPETMPFNNRPTTKHPVPADEPGATVWRILLPEGGSEDSPRTWSRTDGRHGTYIEYLPDEHKSAIWLEEVSNPPMAMVLFGPDPASKTDDELSGLFTSLRQVLEKHGYTFQS